MTEESDIQKSLHELTEEAAGIRAEVQRVNRITWAIGGVITIIILVGMLVILDNRRAIAENNRRWCPIVSLLVARPGDPPPTTERGRLIAERASVLATDFDCIGR